MFLTSHAAFSQSKPIGKNLILEEEVPQEKNWEQRFIDSNIAISEWFDSASDGLDLFLVGRRVTKAKNKTQFRVENTTFSTEGEDVTNNTGVNVFLNLPNVEKYWQLKFTSYDDQAESRSVRRTYLRQTPRQENYGASVGVFRKLGKIRVSFEPRIELTDPLKVSHSLQFESVADMKNYRVNPKFELFAHPTKGVGTFQRINFNFALSKKYSLTLINEGEYQEKIRTYLVTNGFSVGHSVDKKRALAYTALFLSSSRPNYHLDAINLSVAWNEILYKKILDYQLIPNYEFAQSRNFRGKWGLTLNFNLTF
jgi:hypothetical protein